MAHIERPRFSCMLGGVLATISALPKTVPVIHGAQGCGGTLANTYALGGYLGVGYCGGQSSPSSNIGETEIIFGGTDRLAKQIRNTFDVMEGDLYIVTTTCMTEIIGDDVEATIKELGPLDKPVLFLDTGGFKGNSYYGYSKLVEALFEQYIPKSEDKKKNLVNLWGLVPGYDPYFRGDLEEIRRVLARIGVEANTFLTSDQTQQNLLSAGEASLNIVFSRVYGTEAARIAKDTHGIDYLVTELPIGSTATAEFIRQVAQKLQLDGGLVEEAIQKESDRYYTFVDRASDVIADTDFQNYAVVIANATEALPYSKYLDNEIGWIAGYVFITDELNEEQKDEIRSAFEQTEFVQRPELVFETDTYRIQQYLETNNPQFRADRYYETFAPAFVLGSTIDRKFSVALGGNLLSISFPVINRIVISKAYAGYNGGLNLLEDLITAQITGR